MERAAGIGFASGELAGGTDMRALLALVMVAGLAQPAAAGWWDNDKRGGYGYDKRDSRYRESFDAGFKRGFNEGVREGADDRRHNRRFDVDRDRAYRDTDRGYHSGYGSRRDYEQGYRSGYREGYQTGRLSVFRGRPPAC
jgi:hypothetical protein